MTARTNPGHNSQFHFHFRGREKKREKEREAREEETKPSRRFHAPFTRPSCGKFRKKAVLMRGRRLVRFSGDGNKIKRDVEA